MSRKSPLGTPKRSNTNSPIRILIADDQRVVRARIEEILSRYQDLKVVGMAIDGDKAIALTKSLQPDVILMDIEMPKLNGIKVTEVVSQHCSKSKVLVISTHAKAEYIREIVSAGADGYILKQTPAADLVAAIHAVHKGYSHFGPQLLKKAQLVSASSQSPIEPITDKPHAIEQSIKTKQSPQPYAYLTQNWLTGASVGIALFLSAIIPLASEKRDLVEAAATVYSPQEVKVVRAQALGQIAEILVRSGDTVRSGQTIATLDSQQQSVQTQLETAIAQGRSQLNQIDSRLGLVESQIKAETESNQAKVQVAEARLIGKQRTDKTANITTQGRVSAAKAALQSAETRLKTAQNKLARYQSVGSGGLSQEYLLEAELEVLEREQEITALKAELKNTLAVLNVPSNEIEVARQNIAANKKSAQVAIANLNRDKAALFQQRLAIEHQLEQDSLELNRLNSASKPQNPIATATGKIQLNLNPGQTVQQGEEIAQIVFESGELEIIAQVSPRDIGKIKLGQPVEIQSDRCPKQEHGVLQGKVSQTPTNPPQPLNNKLDSDTEASTSADEVIITLASSTSDRENNVCALKSGMKTTAQIVTRKESMMKFILRKARLIGNV